MNRFSFTQQSYCSRSLIVSILEVLMFGLAPFVYLAIMSPTRAMKTKFTSARKKPLFLNGMSVMGAVKKNVSRGLLYLRLLSCCTGLHQCKCNLTVWLERPERLENVFKTRVQANKRSRACVCVCDSSLKIYTWLAHLFAMRTGCFIQFCNFCTMLLVLNQSSDWTFVWQWWLRNAFTSFCPNVFLQWLGLERTLSRRISLCILAVLDGFVMFWCDTGGMNKVAVEQLYQIGRKKNGFLKIKNAICSDFYVVNMQITKRFQMFRCD